MSTIVDDEDLVQEGRDEMAEALAEYLAGLDENEYDDEYLVGLEDALRVLLEAGANDPR